LNTLIPYNYRNNHKQNVKNFFDDKYGENFQRTISALNKFDKILKIDIKLLLKKHVLSNDVQINLTMAYLREIDAKNDFYLIYPSNPVYILWVVFMICIVIINLLQLPFDYVFIPGSQNLSYDMSILAFYIVDMLLSFFIAIIDENGNVISDR